MLLTIILIAWLVVMALFVAVGRMAARGDAQLEPSESPHRRELRGGLVVWEEQAPAPAAPHARRSHGARKRMTGRGMRTHGIS